MAVNQPKICRTLRYLGLASNRIAVRACTVLAAGMRVSRSLDRVNLDGNPLGLDGAAAIVEALARRYVASVSFTNCNFGTIRGVSDTLAGCVGKQVSHFDIRRPNCVYRCAIFQRIMLDDFKHLERSKRSGFLLRVTKRVLKSTLYMSREPIESNATYGSGAFPTICGELRTV
jgi:hypothetical protein